MEYYYSSLVMSFTNITNLGFGVGSAIMDGATESAASLSRGVKKVVVYMLPTPTNTSLTDEEPCLVTLEEGQQAEREFLDNSVIGDVDCDFCGDLGCVYCDSDDGGNDYDLTQYNDDDCGACDGVGCQYCDN